MNTLVATSMLGATPFLLIAFSLWWAWHDGSENFRRWVVLPLAVVFLLSLLMLTVLIAFPTLKLGNAGRYHYQHVLNMAKQNITNVPLKETLPFEWSAMCIVDVSFTAPWETEEQRIVWEALGAEGLKQIEDYKKSMFSNESEDTKIFFKTTDGKIIEPRLGWDLLNAKGYKVFITGHSSQIRHWPDLCWLPDEIQIQINKRQ